MCQTTKHPHALTLFAERQLNAIAGLIRNTMCINTLTRQTDQRLFATRLTRERARKMEARSTCCLFTLVVAAIISCSTASSPDYFTAAVFEHARRGNVTTDAPADIVRSNLQYYERGVTVAKEQGVDLIMFPESGIFIPVDREQVKDYLEFIPNPKEVRATPCDEADQYSTRPILLALSCMAKNNEIVVVANMGGREPCRGQPDCPEDGQYQYNANVAFDQNGTLIGRYYKEHLFYEFMMDVPREQDPIVETNFGKFAMFICFDILFERSTVVSQQTDIDAILLPVLWNYIPPFFTPIQWWQAWASGNNATLLVANLQLPGFVSTGSGIYLGREGSIVSVFNPDQVPKLAIATVPKRGRNISTTSKVIAITENGTKEWNDNGKDLPTVCSYSILGEWQDISKEYRCINENVSNYTLKKLTGSEGHLKVCNEGLCCELDYAADSMDESFYLGVLNGTHAFFERYLFAEENCFLARCDDVNGTSCSHFRMHSETVFHRLSMKANFSTDHVYPSVMSSGTHLVPVQNWAYTQNTNEASIEFRSNSGIRLLEATLFGRVYDKDPPYVR